MSANISIFRGVSYDIQYNHEDSDGTPVSLEDCTVYLTVKSVESDSSVDDTTAKIKKTLTSADHDNAVGGITTFHLRDNDTQIDVGDYFYDVVVENETTKDSEPPSLYGTFTVVAKVTNRNVGNE